MSWALLSSKYPRSIFENEHPLLILALLERSGMATEHELADLSNLASHEVKKILLDLKLNNVIEYGSKHVRLTNQGKFIIERFDLQEAIIEDFLDNLQLKGNERNDYKKIALRFRNDNYSYYQNSVCGVRVWSYLANKVPSEKNTNQLKKETTAGMRSIFIRDIRNWIRHSSPKEFNIKHKNSNIRLALIEEDFSKIHSKKVKDSLFFKYLTALEKPDDNLKLKYDLKLTPLIFTLQFLQSASEPYQWFDYWCEATSNFPNERRFTNSKNYMNRIRKVIEKTLGDYFISSESNKLETLLFEKWAQKEPVVNFGDDFIGLLLNVSDIDELSSKTGIQKKILRNSLTVIQNKCQEILGSSGK